MNRKKVEIRLKREKQYIKKTKCTREDIMQIIENKV